MARSSAWKLAKIGIFLLCLGPAIYLVWGLFNDGLGADPVDAIRDVTGDWTLRFLLITLAVSPIRQITGWADAIRFRRMLGLYAFFYGFVHFFTYLWLDQLFDWNAIVEDVVERPWITFGVLSFVLMVPLAITSTKKWIGRLGGKRWQLLHRLVYVSAAAGVVHYILLVKLDSTRPLRYALALAVLLGYRGFATLRKMRNLIAVVVFGLMAVNLMAQNPEDFTLKVDVDLTLFNVTVQDRKGNLVSGLDQKSFKIIEDGREQKIDFFRPEDIPATVGLIIDNSGSMTAKRAEVIEAALAFARASNPQDEVFIVNFNDNVWMGLPAAMPFSSDFTQLEKSLRGIHALGRTALYDAIAKGLEHLEKGRHQRKALIVLSDGGDNASSQTLEGSLLQIQQSEATVYTIGIYDVDDRYKNPGVLKKIAKQGGGEAYFPKSPFELRRVWERIAGGIRTQYTVGFTPTNQSKDGSFRKVQIRATGKDGKALVVRSREGYAPPVVLPESPDAPQ